MSIKLPRKILSVVAALVVAFFVITFDESCLHIRGLSENKATEVHVQRAIVKPYTQTHIELTVPHVEQFQIRILVFNGTNFVVYDLETRENDQYRMERSDCDHCGMIVPLLVRALTDLNPARFKPGQPVFQLVFSDADYFSSVCVNHGKCQVYDFAPVLLFGSAPKNRMDAPTVQGFPHMYYHRCLYYYIMVNSEKCGWSEPVEKDIDWDSLTPTIVWRGANWGFIDRYVDTGKLGDFYQSIDVEGVNSKRDAIERIREHWDDLTPRWKAIVLTNEAELNNDKWIDVKYNNGSYHCEDLEKFESESGLNVVAQQISSDEMSHYKYQIDFGGLGGTTWKGTITKLGMPGVLFHHQTPSRDFFYDEMKPWIHFIPVNCDLSDLREKYEWAVANDEEVKRIAKDGQRLHERLLHREYIAGLYQTLFVDYLGEVLNAYIPTNETWSSMQNRYRENGFRVLPIGECDDVDCVFKMAGGKDATMRYASYSYQPIRDGSTSTK